jgi:Fe-S-cluster-containing dehydrogenase component
VTDGSKKKTVKTIKIDVDKCNGCRACEVICSAFHAEPKYSSNNPASVPSAGLPAHPDPSSKSPIPTSL